MSVCKQTEILLKMYFKRCFEWENVFAHSHHTTKCHRLRLKAICVTGERNEYQNQNEIWIKYEWTETRKKTEKKTSQVCDEIRSLIVNIYDCMGDSPKYNFNHWFVSTNKKNIWISFNAATKKRNEWNEFLCQCQTITNRTKILSLFFFICRMHRIRLFPFCFTKIISFLFFLLFLFFFHFNLFTTYTRFFFFFIYGTIAANTIVATKNIQLHFL